MNFRRPNTRPDLGQPGKRLPKRPVVDDKFWEHLRYKGVLYKTYFLSTMPPADKTPWYRDHQWQTLKRYWAQQKNSLPLLIYYAYPQDPPPSMFQRRGRRKPKGSFPFVDLPFPYCIEADHIFRRLCEKWADDLPSWRRAILAGRARYLALHPPDSDWGKRMRRIKGGVHCQRKYRKLGQHPLPAVSRALAKRQQG
jgi:hypothetical protein